MDSMRSIYFLLPSKCFVINCDAISKDFDLNRLTFDNEKPQNIVDRRIKSPYR